MIPELELTVVQPAGDLGYVAGFAITEAMIHVAGGTSSHAPIVLASSNARRFQRQSTPRDLGLRAIAALRDEIWICGEFGQLARSSDHGATWTLVPTQTDACLFAVAVVGDELWVVGDQGFCARVRGERLERVDLGTCERLAGLYEHAGDVVIVGRDGVLRRWRGGELSAVPTGATTPLTALAITRRGTWIAVGDRGFITRSPDGAWFSRAASGVDVDLEAVATLADGRVVIVGDCGQILISTDDGRTWHAQASQLGAHLWSVARFGDGALVGGDAGLIARLAPTGDTTWADRDDVFGAPSARDAWFAAGPDGFVETRLSTLFEDEDEGDDEDDDEDDDDDDEDDDDADDDDGDGDADDTDGEVFQTASFAAVYGIELPPEAAALAAAIGGRRVLGLAARMPIEPAGANLFEQLVLRDQRDPRATRLVEAFSGVFRIGRRPNGDTHHLELYGWDAPRQVLRFDRSAQTLGVVADSLDSFAYAAAVARAGLTGDDALLAARALAGRVAPLEPEHRDTEFLFCRSRWLCALLRGDRGAIAGLFDADLNQVVPADQLPARLAACERYVPTALYSLVRAFCFDEPELARYLEIARGHRARLVRDAAALVGELRAGRNELGAIRDVRAHLDAFRALGLHPRRTSRTAAEIASAPRAAWTELAWRTLDDGAAHRALLVQLDRAPALAAQLAALDELCELSDHDRRVAIPMLAATLAPELEAVLVGSLVRGDALEGVLHRPPLVADHAPGIDAIRRALAAVYHGAEPAMHFETEVPYGAFGSDPIDGISVYLRAEPVPHFHVVTFGFTEQHEKLSHLADRSGYGFELTLRLARRADETELPGWARDLLQDLGRIVFESGRAFELHQLLDLEGPIAPGGDTALTAVVFAADPELGELESEFGSARFLQIVGITGDEHRLASDWSAEGLLEVLAARAPFLVTDLSRPSVLGDAELARAVRARVGAEGTADVERPEAPDVDEPPTGVVVLSERDPEQIRAALRMTERAIRLAPTDPEVQLAHAMLMLDADGAGLDGKLDALLRGLPALEPMVRVSVVARLADADHVQLGAAVDAVVADVVAGDDLGRDALVKLGAAIIRHVPDRFVTLLRLLPDDVDVLCSLAYKAIVAGERAQALALFDRLVAMPIPADGEQRKNYLRMLDLACGQLRAIQAYDTAVRIADRAQPIAHENPDFYHEAARAYAAVGEYAKAFHQVQLAFEHDYDHLGTVETDEDLGPLREWPEFKALFLDWHARQEGN